MPDEGEQMHMEHQSNAGKWILIVVALIVGSCIAYREACRLPPRLAAGDTPTSAPR